MEEIKALIQFMSDYGIMFVICGLFLYVVIRIVNIYLKQLEAKVGDKKARDSHDKLLDYRSNIGSEIQNLINQTLINTHGNRIHVVEFSNSMMSVAYLPFRYMTCTYEAYAIGKTATGDKMDRISTSLFSQFFAKLQDSQHLTFDIRDKSCLVGGAMCELMQSQGEYHAICAPMITVSKKFIGFVYITKDDEFTEEDGLAVETIADKVCALLSIADK